MVIAEVAGEDTARAIQLRLEYSPAPPFHSGSPETAPTAIRDKVAQKLGQQVTEKLPVLECAARHLSIY